VEDRLERPIERLTQQINILGEKIKGTQSIIPSDGGSTFKREESPVLTPREKSRERQKAIEFGKALGIGNYASKGKLEDLTPAAIRPNVAAVTSGPVQPGGGFSILGMIGKVIGSIFKVLNYVSLYKLAKPFIEKFFGKNVITDTLFAIFDPIVGIVDSLKQMFIDWFKKTFPKTYEVIVGIVDTVKKAFSWVWEKLKATFNWVKSFFEAPDKMKFLSDAWEGLKGSIKEMFKPKEGEQSLWDWIKMKLGDVWQSVSDWVNKKLEEWDINGIFKDFKSTFDRAIVVADRFMDFLESPEVEAIIANFRKLSDWIAEHGEFLGNAALRIVTNTDELVKNISEMVKEFREQVWPQLKEQLIGIIKEQLTALRESLEKSVNEKLTEITGVIKDKLNQITSEVIAQVRSIGAACISAINAAAAAIAGAAASVSAAAAEVSSAAASARETSDSAREVINDPVGYIKDKGKQMIKESAPYKAYEGVKAGVKKGASTISEKVGGAWEATKNFFGVGKKANDFLVSKRGDFVNFSNQDNVLGFKDGGSIDRVLGRKDDALITDTRQILIESRKQVSLLQKIVENTYNANLLLQKLNNRPAQQPSRANTGTNNLVKFNRSEFDIETSPSFNFAGNLATI
jgi:methyl-accepting chemotaxis protein